MFKPMGLTLLNKHVILHTWAGEDQTDFLCNIQLLFGIIIIALGFSNLKRNLVSTSVKSRKFRNTLKTRITFNIYERKRSTNKLFDGLHDLFICFILWYLQADENCFSAKES